MLDADSERLLAHGTSRLTDLPPARPAARAARGAVDRSEPPRARRRPIPTCARRPTASIAQEVWDELSGREILRRQLAGELPPPPLSPPDRAFARSTIGEGKATVVMPATRVAGEPDRPASGRGDRDARRLRDADRGRDDRARPGWPSPRLDLKVNFLRPGAADGDRPDRARRGRPRRRARSRSLAPTVTNAEGKPVLLATGSSIYLPGRPASLGEVGAGRARRAPASR